MAGRSAADVSFGCYDGDDAGRGGRPGRHRGRHAGDGADAERCDGLVDQPAGRDRDRLPVLHAWLVPRPSPRCSRRRSTYVGTYDAQGTTPRRRAGRDGTVSRRAIVGGAGAELLWLAGAPTGRVWAVTTRQVDETTASRLSLVGQEAPLAP